MSKPKVSIIIPCYNTEGHIAKAIQSALDQTYPDIEVIVVDDGSTDDSLQIIKSFGSKIKWATGPNKGACIARNKGLNMASGSLINFLDADDRMTTDCVRNKVDFCVTPDTIVCCGIEIDQQPPLTEKDLWGKIFYDREVLLRDGSPQTSAPLHHRSMLLAVGGFKEDLGCHQEYDLHLRLHLKFGVNFLSNRHIGVIMTRLPTSISYCTPRAKKYLIDWEVTRHAEKELRAGGELTLKDKDALAIRYSRIAIVLRECGFIEESNNMLIHASTLSRKGYKAYRRKSFAFLAKLIGISNAETAFSKLRKLKFSK